jgi:1,4-alpha-glucan branching enzyme
VRRFKTHLHRFHRLAGMAESGHYDEAYLREISARDSLFPDMDYRIFQARPW